MILADTSVWIDYIRDGSSALEALLEDDEMLMHPFIITELGLGNLKDREERLRQLSRLPSVVQATHAEAMRLLEVFQLWGRGIGYVDLHLLASVRLSDDALLWSRDRRLMACAELLGLGFLAPGSA